jgi:DNA-binding XRE family transcriptional regulator
MQSCTQAVDDRTPEHPYGLRKLAHSARMRAMPTTPTRKRLTGPTSGRLLSARNEAGLSRKALADLIGISERAVAYYEDHTYARARKPIVVRAWAEACGRTFEELWPQRDVEVRRRACNGNGLRPRARAA